MKKRNIITIVLCFSLILLNTNSASAANNSLLQSSKSLSIYTSTEKSEIINIPDLNLKRVINEKLGKSKNADITKAELESIENIWLQDEKVTNLEGLQYCINLKTLSMRYNNISNLSPLSGLDNLQHIDLAHNTITNIDSLNSLKNLNKLILSYNNISNISSLKNFNSLQQIEMADNKIVDISALSQLTNLTSLDLSWNSITNIQPLANLNNLSGLNLSNNKIKDITYLSKLSNLSCAYLSGNNIENVELNSLINLSALDLSNNKIINLSLKNMPQLGNDYFGLDLSNNKNMKSVEMINLPCVSTIDFSNNQISDITLENLTNLYDVNLNNNKISNLSGIDLSKSKVLNTLKLSNNQISNLKGIKFTDSESFYHLDLSNNNLNDISSLPKINAQVILLNNNKLNDINSLSKLTNITCLYLSNNNIKDINALSKLTDLIYLELNNNQINNISPLYKLLNLSELSMSGNEIKDISSLSNLSLTSLNLSDNKISNITPLKNMKIPTYRLEISLDRNAIDINGKEAREVISTLKNRGYKVKYSEQVVKTLAKFKTFTLNTIKSTSKTITGTGEKGATVKAYVGSKEIGKATVGSNGKYTIKIKAQKNGAKITVKMSKSSYTAVSKTKTVINDKFTKTLTVNSIKSTSKTINGKGEKGATVKVYVGSKQIGKATIDSKGNYKISISKQSKNKKIMIKMSKTGYSTVSKTVTVK